MSTFSNRFSPSKKTGEIEDEILEMNLSSPSCNLHKNAKAKEVVVGDSKMGSPALVVGPNVMI